MKIQTHLILFIATILFSSCKDRVSSSSFVGVWTVQNVNVSVDTPIDKNSKEFEEGSEEITAFLLKSIFTIKSNGTYKAIEYYDKSTTKGIWNFNDETNTVNFFQTELDEPNFIWNVKSVNKNQMKVKMKLNVEALNPLSFTLTLNKQNNE